MDDIKQAYIELFEFNFVMSLLDFFNKNLQDKTIQGKNLTVVQSYHDKNLGYIPSSLALDILYRKNRSIGFGNSYGDIERVNDIIEIDGTIFEYRVQLNVYSNTRGENYKWCSILDEILKKGEIGIPLNTYLDNGSIKQSNIGNISYDFSIDVKNNPALPNVNTYDHRTIYEVKMTSLQQYRVNYNYMEIGDIIGHLKNI